MLGLGLGLVLGLGLGLGFRVRVTWALKDGTIASLQANTPFCVGTKGQVRARFSVRVRVRVTVSA